MFHVEIDGDLVKVDEESLVQDEWHQVVLTLANYALVTGQEPDQDVKLAAIALQVLRRDPRRALMGLEHLVHYTPVAQVRPDEPMEVQDQFALLANVAGT